MKKKNLFMLAFLFMATAMFTFTSCDKDDDNGDDTFTVSFNVVNDGGNDVLDATITLGETTNAPGDYVFEDVPTGLHSFTVEAFGFLTATGSVTVSDMDVSQSVALEDEGIIGNWISEGDNVASLLVDFFNIEKIIAEFNENGTYHVETYDSEDVKTELAGTYVMEKTGVDDIWNITLQQSTPTSLVSEGIFKIVEGENGREMYYEVVQTDPSLGYSPPTAEGGFGSTGGGSLGDSNVQYYVEIAE